MLVNFIDVSGIFKKASTASDLLASAENYIGTCDSAASRYDIICSLYLRRRSLGLKNSELCGFIRKFLPKVYCVYTLYNDKDLVYIGSTCSLDSRLYVHSKDKVFNRVEVCVKATKEEMVNLENHMINTYQPLYNKTSNIKRSKAYGGNILNEVFVPLQEFIWELPVRRASGKALYKYFTCKLFKYGSGSLNSNGKHVIPAFYIQTI